MINVGIKHQSTIVKLHLIMVITFKFTLLLLFNFTSWCVILQYKMYIYQRGQMGMTRKIVASFDLETKPERYELNMYQGHSLVNLDH